MRRLAVFCGSLAGEGPEFRRAAGVFGAALARRGIGLVYGGGNVGLMGVVADAVLAAGGEAIGVIPKFLLDREVAHGGLSSLVVVGSMHERKTRMADLADGFVALPGGVGTLEELFEAWTWNLLGLHAKPCGLLDVADYYAPLVRFLDGMVDRGFVSAPHRAVLCVENDPETLLDALLAHPKTLPPAKWTEKV